MKKPVSDFKHNKLIKTHRCIQVLDIFDISDDRYRKTIEELDQKGIDYYTKTTIVYYLPK